MTEVKSLEKICCHSNQSSYPTEKTTLIYVDANVIKMYTKYQLHPSYVLFLRRKFLTFFLKFILFVSLATNQNNYMEGSGSAKIK